MESTRDTTVAYDGGCRASVGGWMEMGEGLTLVLGRYRLAEMIGEGAFGVVNRAFDTRLKRLVALKTLKHSLAAVDPGYFRLLEDRFTREAEAGSRAGSHPNLVTVYDLATDDDGTRYLVLEYIAGGTLAEHLHVHGALPIADALRLTGDIARGLHAAHKAGIVHRDVKPSNIFLSADGRAQVGDFGIAQIDNLSRRTQITTGHPGTPLYMSPEQATSSMYVRPLSDQFSLGLIFFEMLTGEVYRRLGKRNVEALIAGQSHAVAIFLSRMLAEDPDERYPSLVEVGAATAALERHWGEYATTQPPDVRGPNRTIVPSQTERADTPPLPTAPATDIYANVPYVAERSDVAPVVAPRENQPPGWVVGSDMRSAEGRIHASRKPRMLWALPLIVLALIAVAAFGIPAITGGRNGQATATPPPTQTVAATVTATVAVRATSTPDLAGQYTHAQSLLAQGDYVGAAEAFMQAGAYRDAPRQAAMARVLADQQTAYAQGIKALDTKDYIAAAQAFQAAGQYKDAPRAYAYSSGFVALANGSYEDASPDFVAAGDFRDAAAQRRIVVDLMQKKQAYDAGTAAAAKGDWSEAVKQFTAAGNTMDAQQQLARAQEEQGLATKYNDAQALLKQNKYGEAYPLLTDVEKMRSTYRDVADILKHLRTDVANPVVLDLGALDQSTEKVGFITPVNNLIGQPVAFLRVVRRFTYGTSGAPNVMGAIRVELVPSGDPNAPKSSPTSPLFVASDEPSYRGSLEEGEQIVLASRGAKADIAGYGSYQAQFTIRDVTTASNVRLPGNQQARYPTFTKLVIEVGLQTR